MTKDNELHLEAMERYENAYAFDNAERYKAIDDSRFVLEEGAMWEDSYGSQDNEKPKTVTNKITPAINQVVGEYRQNRVAIKVRPAKDGSEEVAETYTGLIRNITSVSKAQNAYDTAFKNVVTGGFGAWRIYTQESNNDTFDQDICIKGIVSPATDVWIDPDSKDPNGRDAKYMFLITELSRTEYARLYPNAAISEFNGGNAYSYGNSCYGGWNSVDSVRVAEYWVREEVKEYIILLSDDRVITEEKFEKIGDELAQQGITEVKRRKVTRNKIKFYRLSGTEILDGPLPWQGKYIPIVLTYGYNQWLDNIHYYQGIVRNAKDPQRVLNFSNSAILEATMQAIKDPWILTAPEIAGHEKLWANANVKNTPFLLYNATINNPAGPRRLGAPSVQQALLMQAQQAGADIQATTGLFAPSLGDTTGDQSGKAILAVQRQGDRGSTELFDNLAKAIEYSGEILVDLIPKIYDSTRQVRVLAEDGSTTMVPINETIIDEQTGQEVVVNDLSEGQYDLTMSSGPDYATKRTESVNTLSTMAASNPALAPLLADLMAKNLDLEFGDELENRIRKQALGLPVMEPNEEEAQALQAQQQAQMEAEQSNNELNAKLTAMQLTAGDLANEELAAKIDGMEIDNEAKRVDIEKTRADIFKTLADANVNKMKAGAPVTHADVEAMDSNIEMLNAQMDISEVMLSQEAAEINPTGQKMESNHQGEQEQPKKPTVLIKDPESGLLVNVETEEVFDPNTNERLN